MKRKIVKIGFAGCGWIVDKAHIPAYINLEDVQIFSVFDVCKSRVIDLAGRYNIPGVYDDYDEFLKSGIDAVIIATPNFTHADYSIRALEHGVHVLCEKPVAINTEEIKNVINVANKQNRLFIPGFVNRFREDICIIRKLVSNDRIGEITDVKAGWLRRAGIPRPRTWFTNKELSGGGVLIDLGSHIIDICLMFLGKAVPREMSLLTNEASKTAQEAGASWFKSDMEGSLPVDVEDMATGRISFEEGATMGFEVGWSAPVERDCTYFILTGTKGQIKLKTLFGFSDDRLWKEDSLSVESTNSEPEDICINMDTNNSRKAFFSLAEYFVNCIRGEKANVLGSDDALRNVETIERLYKSQVDKEFDFKTYIPGCVELE